MLAAIEWDKLLQVVWVSIVAGVGLTALFSMVIYGSTRAAENRREGRGGPATFFGIVAILSGLAVAGGVAFGVAIILDK